MNLLSLVGVFGKPILDLLGWAGKEISDWSTRRDAIKEAQLKATVADLEAKAELAAYRAASEVEWDLAWAGQASTSWKDEYILILWSLPAIILFPCFLIPPLRGYAMETLSFFQSLNPDILVWYMSGWGIIFAATFGMRSALQAMVGDRVSKVVSAFELLPDDIPKAAVQLAQEAISRTIQHRPQAATPKSLTSS